MKTHAKNENIVADPDTVCKYCLKVYTTKSNCTRHMTLCKSRFVTNDAKAEKVTVEAEKVTVGAEKVTVGAEKVTVEAEKVTLGAEKVTDTTNGDEDGTQSYKCKDCYKTFTRMHRLNEHKATCQKITNPLMCPTCRKICTSKMAKTRHMASCDPTAIVIPPGNNVVAASPPAQGQIQTINGNNNNNTYNQCTTNVNVTNNNIILNFGNESAEHITKEQKDSWVQMLRGRGIMKFLEAVHFNPEIPQNHNILLDGTSRKVLKVFQNDKWVRRAASEVTDILIANGKNTLLDHYLNSPPLREADKDGHIIYTDLVNTSAESKPNIYYKLVNQIICKIIDVTEAIIEEEGNGSESQT